VWAFFDQRLTPHLIWARIGLGVFGAVFLAGAVFWLWLFRAASRKDGVFRLASKEDDEHAAEDAADVKRLMSVRAASYFIVAATAIPAAIFRLNWPMWIVAGALLLDASFSGWLRRRARQRDEV
jgi:hypothetical protein